MSSSGDTGLMPPLSIRTATEADLSAVAAIHIASWQDAYRGIVPDRVLARRTVEGALRGWRSTFAAFPLNIRVATDESGAVKGFCCAGPVTDYEANAPFEFQIYGLHVLPVARRQGIGAALLHDAFRRATEDEGMTSAIVWTLDALTLSRKFYEREGGELVKTGVWEIDGAALPEVAYGWRELGR
jgi:ribosomal protein S18 acetylase RimI-like enzyme